MLALKLRFWRKLFFIAVSTSYSFLCLRVLISVSTRTYFREYVVLIYGTSLINYFCCFDVLPHEGRATASKFRRIMSAVGTTLLQSPGWNEGKARYETLGIHERKVISSSVGAAL